MADQGMRAGQIIERIKEMQPLVRASFVVDITRAGSVITSHCGPGTLGVLFVAGK